MTEEYSEYKTSSFSPAFLFVSNNQKKALSAVYAFCRIADDIADDLKKNKDEKKAAITKLKENLNLCFDGKKTNRLFDDLKKASEEFGLEKENFQEIIDGVSKDIDGEKFENFEQLKSYMWQVASMPGLLTLRICRYPGDFELALCENLGYAVQMTNIIRDIYTDAQENRFYIPEEDFFKFGVKKEQLKNRQYDRNIKALLLFETNKAKKYYEEALKILEKSPSKQARLSKCILHLYCGLLKKMEKEGFDIIKKIPKISMFSKIKAVLKAIF